MDINMTAGTRDLAPSGSFVAFGEMSRVRVEQGKAAAGSGWQTARPTAHPTHVSTIAFRSLPPIGTGTDVPVLDRMRTSAPEP